VRLRLIDLKSSLHSLVHASRVHHLLHHRWLTSLLVKRNFNVWCCWTHRRLFRSHFVILGEQICILIHGRLRGDRASWTDLSALRKDRRCSLLLLLGLWRQTLACWSSFLRRWLRYVTDKRDFYGERIIEKVFFILIQEAVER
jgi:hypothetical protein